MTKDKIHVTANEAGRNACYLRKLEGALKIIIEAIQNNASKKEIIQCLVILIKYSIKTLKIRPTVWKEIWKWV